MSAQHPSELDAIFDTLREPLLVLDRDHRVLIANRAFYHVFKTTREETEGEILHALGNGQWNIPRLRDLLEEILPQGTHFDDFEVEHTFKEIGRRVMLLNARKIYRSGNHTESILLAIEDVTDRRSAQAALQASNREMEQFAYTVSHDLKSPLVTINGFLGMLPAHIAAGRDDKVKETLGRIVGAAERMGRLIDDLLQLSRIGRIQGDVIEVDTQSLLERLAENYAPRLAETQSTMLVRKPVPRIRTDPERLEEVFDNLISNAIKYACSDGGACVEVGGGRVGDRLRFYVRDDGPGIDPTYHNRIFELFQRLDTKHGGTGVGLARVKKIVEHQGGRVGVDSQLGEGATFWFSFPEHYGVR